MLHALGVRRRPTEIELAMERQIQQRSWGRIHGLSVEVTDSRVVVRGRATCHYVKQLALEGVLDVLGPGKNRQIDLEIQVETRSPRSNQLQARLQT